MKIKKLLFQPSIFSSGKKTQSLKNTLYKEESPNLKNTNLKKTTFYHSAEKNKFDIIKSPTNTHLVKHNIIHLLQDTDDDASNNKRGSHIRSAVNDFEDVNFYTQIKMKRKSCKNCQRIKKNNNYEDKISKNIENNKQNLNNPKEYFSGLFNKILIKTQK